MSLLFSFSFGTLTQRSDRIDSLLLRDAEQFTAKGYDETFRTDLQSRTAAFKQLPSDDYWLGQQMLKTNAKNKAFDDLLDLIDDVRSRAKRALGEDSVQYRSLRFGKLRKIKEQDLVLFAGQLTKACREMLEALAKRGLTEEMLTQIDTLTTELDAAIDEQKDMIATREAKALEREDKGNEIYRLIAEACDVGKEIWEGKNQAYYDDYVIYGSQTAGDEEEDGNDNSSPAE